MYSSEKVTHKLGTFSLNTSILILINTENLEMQQCVILLHTSLAHLVWTPAI